RGRPRTGPPTPPPASTTSPVSSTASRSAAARKVSPSSTAPPGIDHSPCRGGAPRRTSKTRPPSVRSTISAPTPTIGRSGYSRGDRLTSIRLGTLQFRILGLHREKTPRINVDELPSAGGILRNHTEPRLLVQRQDIGIARVRFHLDIH